jgi:hypothetical protein
MCQPLRAVRASVIVTLMTIALAGPALPRNISALSCSELWFHRNSIFKSTGYCFHTQRAIRVFGNAWCEYDSEHDVPLSDRNRRAINAIQQVERKKRCPP